MGWRDKLSAQSPLPYNYLDVSLLVTINVTKIQLRCLVYVHSSLQTSDTLGIEQIKTKERQILMDQTDVMELLILCT